MKVGVWNGGSFPPPSAPFGVILPAGRTKLASAHDLGPDAGSVLLGQGVIDAPGAPWLAEDLAAGEPRGEHPFVKALAGMAEWRLE